MITHSIHELVGESVTEQLLRQAVVCYQRRDLTCLEERYSFLMRHWNQCRQALVSAEVWKPAKYSICNIEALTKRLLGYRVASSSSSLSHRQALSPHVTPVRYSLANYISGSSSEPSAAMSAWRTSFPQANVYQASGPHGRLVVMKRPTRTRTRRHRSGAPEAKHFQCLKPGIRLPSLRTTSQCVP